MWSAVSPRDRRAADTPVGGWNSLGKLEGDTKTQPWFCLRRRRRSSSSTWFLWWVWWHGFKTQPWSKYGLSLLPSRQFIATPRWEVPSCSQLHVLMSSPKANLPPEAALMPTGSGCPLSPSLLHISWGSPSFLALHLFSGAFP